MKLDSYKYAYPRTLLADVLALLIEQRGIDFATLAHLSGVNRGTIHGIACAKRSCDLETRRAILAPLVTCDGHAQRLALLFDREAETLLTVPEVVTSIEPTLAARRQRALAAGLDIGALGGRYGLNEIYSDALAMERAGRGNVACRWASYLVAAAQKHGTPQTELRAGIFSARLHLACSRFVECRAAIMSILRRCGPPLPDAVNIPNIDAIPSQVHAQVILGWLEYELGRYDEALRNLNAAIVAIAGAGPEAHGDYGFPLSLALLNALKDRGDSQCVAGERFGCCSPLALMNLALHTRAKVLAERCMYMPEYLNESNTLFAARALAQSAVFTSFVGNRGMLGHELLWIARLAAMRAAHIGGDDFFEESVLSAEGGKILRGNRTPESAVLLRALATNTCVPTRLLSLASRECFDGFQSSPLSRAYHQRAKASVAALDGECGKALANFEEAYDLLTHYVPDARGLGPLFYERHLMHAYNPPIDDNYAHLQWLFAAAAVHPTQFVLNAIQLERHRARREKRCGEIGTSARRVLSFQGPFTPLQKLGISLWGNAARGVMSRNIAMALGEEPYDISRW